MIVVHRAAGVTSCSVKPVCGLRHISIFRRSLVLSQYRRLDCSENKRGIIADWRTPPNVIGCREKPYFRATGW